MRVLGNIETLKDIPKEKGIDVRKLLLEFHDRYYSVSWSCIVSIQVPFRIPNSCMVALGEYHEVGRSGQR